MTASKPLVSIGMPIRNEERYLSLALDSLLSQDYDNMEIIIVDNASDDCTGVICREYAAQDKRIHYFRNEANIGAIENFAKVAELARGKYFMWAGGHDRWEREFVSRCIGPMEMDDEVVLVYPQMQDIGKDGKTLPHNCTWLFDTRSADGRISRYNTFLWGCPSPALIYGLIRTSAVRKLNLRRTCYAPDWLLLAELALFGKFAQVTEQLLQIRILREGETWEQLISRYRQQLTGSKTRHSLFPFWEVALHFIKVPWRSDMDTGRKIFLSLCALPYCVVKWGHLMIWDINRMLPWKKR